MKYVRVGVYHVHIADWNPEYKGAYCGQGETIMNVYLYNGRYYYNPYYVESSVKPGDVDASWAWKEVFEHNGTW